MIQKLKIAICDDEPVFSEYLSGLINEYFMKKETKAEIVQYLSGEAFVRQGEQMSQYHIVFMDVDMGEMDGLMTAEQLRQVSEQAILIFVTAYLSYALEGYKVQALRYIIKGTQNMEATITEALDCCVKELELESPVLELACSDGVEKLLIERIIYMESHLHQVSIHYDKGKKLLYQVRDTLNHLTNQVDIGYFCRVHQSYLVNMNFVKRLRSRELILTDGTILPVSRTRYAEVRKKYSVIKGAIR